MAREIGEQLPTINARSVKRLVVAGAVVVVGYMGVPRVSVDWNNMGCRFGEVLNNLAQSTANYQRQIHPDLSPSPIGDINTAASSVCKSPTITFRSSSK